MKAITLTDPHDYMALLVRRKWWILVPFLVLMLLWTAVTFALPNIYVSETLILVEPREVPDDFVKDLVSVNTEERLESIREIIFSRTNLLQIIRDFQAGLTELEGLNDEEKVERMREEIVIEFQRDPRRRDSIVSYFNIAYQNQNPELAQQITARLADLFIQYDAKTREEQVQGTAEFMELELRKVADQLQEADQRLKALKERYRYELPEQLQSNLSTLERLQGRAVANQEALDRYFSQRQSLERQLSETPPVLFEDPSEKLRRPPGQQPTVSPLVEEYRLKEQLLLEMETKYTEKHPDVVRLKAELNRLRQEIPPADLLVLEQPEYSPAVSRPNPAYQSLLSQLNEVKTEIEIKKADQQRTEGEIRRYQARVQNTPARELELTEVQRRYSELQEQYDNLKEKLDAARLAVSLENRQKGAQFVIQDPAGFPLVPAKPNRLKVWLIGFFASLLVALGLGFTVDITQQKVWTQSELEQLLGVPVLIEIPDIQPEAVRGGKRAKRLLSAAAVIVVALFTGVAGFTVYSNPRLRAVAGEILEPIVRVVARLS